MFSYALRHPRNPAQDGIMNAMGLTPLTLACRLARSTIFKEMLELTCIEFWRYSNITCSAYPLNALDTIRPSGQTSEWNRGGGDRGRRRMRGQGGKQGIKKMEKLQGDEYFSEHWKGDSKNEFKYKKK